jgi:glycosyltransferase involved in cell wall biosynthesis
MGKRVLITARLNGAGGVETHLLNLCRLLIQHGADVTLVSRCVNPETPLMRLRQEIPIRFISTPFAHDLRWFRLSTAWALAVWPLLLRRDFDVLLTIEASPFTKFLAAFLRPNGRALLNRAGALARSSDILNPHARSVLSGVLVESSLQAEAARCAFGLTVPVVGLPLLSHSGSVPRRDRRLCAGDALRIAFLGRFDPAKGIYRLLDLWPKLKLSSARLDFYGHGPERDRLVKMICVRGLTDRVAVHGGWADAAELTTIMNRTDMIVLPSEAEGLPLVLLEAMAYGVPFVATEVGAVRTLAEENPDVQIVSCNDESLQTGIESLARGLRNGQIQGERLQAYHQARYGYESLSRLWVAALLQAEDFWQTTSATSVAFNSAASNTLNRAGVTRG